MNEVLNHDVNGIGKTRLLTKTHAIFALVVIVILIVYGMKSLSV
jgi:hypothetical protein